MTCGKISCEKSGASGADPGSLGVGPQAVKRSPDKESPDKRSRLVRIAVIGARGQMGAALVRECSRTHDVIPLARGDLDITDDAAIGRVLEAVRPNAILNCAAYNTVDLAEEQPAAALSANAFAVRAIAHTAERIGAMLVHFSTDFVFDGEASVPYSETDTPGPRSVYAASKLVGEWFALDVPRAYVLRVESLFGLPPAGPPKGTVAVMVADMLDGRQITVFEDRTVSPTYITDAVRATRQLVESGPPAGLYHCVGSGRCTWLEFALELAKQLGVEPHLARIEMSRARLRAARPRFSALSNAKLRDAGIEMPTWQDAVARYVREVRASPPQSG